MWVKAYLGNDVVFKSSQTPLIYDPMSAIVFGFASCTGQALSLWCNLDNNNDLILLRCVNSVCGCSKKCRNSSQSGGHTSMEWSDAKFKKKCLFLFEGDPESGNHNWIEVFDHRYVQVKFYFSAKLIQLLYS